MKVGAGALAGAACDAWRRNFSASRAAPCSAGADDFVRIVEHFVMAGRSARVECVGAAGAQTGIAAEQGGGAMALGAAAKRITAGLFAVGAWAAGAAWAGPQVDVFTPQ